MKFRKMTLAQAYREGFDIMESLATQEPQEMRRVLINIYKENPRIFIRATNPGKDRYSLVLDSYENRKIEHIKCVRTMTGLGLKEAKDLVEAVPAVVSVDGYGKSIPLIHQDALRIMKECGMQVRIVPFSE